MNWDRFRFVMEHDAIKIDDMATEDAYFMATHMPFSQLEVYRGGSNAAASLEMSEEDIFEKIVCNPENEHRMVIVRGDNGTGKSHLIRYLKAKLEMSPSTVYNPATEQLVFLRRLNNSVRGVFSQLIEQKVIRDPDVEEKLRRFIASSEAKDENSFKTDILYSYIAAVSNDQSGEIYKPVICRDIASYLSDSRIKEYLLREGGAISRCYSVITAPSSQVLKDTTVFMEDDFNVNKLIRAVIKQGDPQASDFAMTLKADQDEMVRLVNYLNRFTREVVQRCADITSESAKSVFAQLRKDLKKQGKNLTLFIEDFTGFTGIDSELITALSTEHGGDYEDLCRVTAIIGITNDYYDQFRDNFKDRVTHQISVTDRSFGSGNFLIQMAGRYLNAIYCEPEQIRAWNHVGAELQDLPVSDFAPPCEWDSIKIGEKEVTLYPFNKEALLRLYESLPFKNPRMFLRDVIRAQLKEYFDGKTYGDGWVFPLNPGHFQMARESHSSTIDRMESFSQEDRNRLKSVLALWGDGTASGIRKNDGTLFVGGLNKAFLEDINLGFFSGIGEITDEKTEEPAAKPDQTVRDPKSSELENVQNIKPKERRVDGATQNYNKFKDDITRWFTQNEPLKFDSDYRNWLRVFICGTPNQCGAINWQDCGIPAYVAEQRLASDLGYFYIEAQSNPANMERAIVVMDRSSESRDALMALNELNYAKGWDFDGAVYYQQRLITWLERRKDKIIERVIGSKRNEQKLPVLEWCLAVQYLKACILGQTIDGSSPYTVISSLFQEFQKDDSIVRESKEWRDMIQFVEGRKAEFDSVLALLKRASATTMGAIHYSVDDKTSSCYRADELVSAVEHLMASDWDIEQSLPEKMPPKHLIYNSAALLKSLYSKIKAVVLAEKKTVLAVEEKLTGYVGTLNQENMVNTLAAIQEMFAVFAANSIIGSNQMRTKYERPPIEAAGEIMRHVQLLSDADSENVVRQLAIYSENSLHVLCDFLRDLQTIAQKAEQEEGKARRELQNIAAFEGFDQISEGALSAMRGLYDLVEAMEVIKDAAE